MSAVGDTVEITRRWGTQVRQKCVVCTKFFKGETCQHCGAVYEPLGDDKHKVVALP